MRWRDSPAVGWERKGSTSTTLAPGLPRRPCAAAYGLGPSVFTLRAEPRSTDRASVSQAVARRGSPPLPAMSLGASRRCSGAGIHSRVEGVQALAATQPRSYRPRLFPPRWRAGGGGQCPSAQRRNSPPPPVLPYNLMVREFSEDGRVRRRQDPRAVPARSLRFPLTGRGSGYQNSPEWRAR